MTSRGAALFPAGEKEFLGYPCASGGVMMATIAEQ